MVTHPFEPSFIEHAALVRLLVRAQDPDYEGRRVADFLLAWWNAGKCGAFDLATAWQLDDTLLDDIATVYRLAVRARCYPDALGYGSQFEALVQAWRPELISTV